MLAYINDSIIQEDSKYARFVYCQYLHTNKIISKKKNYLPKGKVWQII